MPVKYKRYLNYLIILGILFTIRVYRLDQAPMADYDSVKNLLIAEEIANGDLSSLFHRRIPTVHLINSLFYRIIPNYLFLEYMHALICSFGVLIFCVFIRDKYHLRIVNFWILSLILGISTVGVATSRYMSIESWTLLCFVLFLIHYVQWIENRDRKKLFACTVLYSLALTVNYKFLFLLPMFVAFEWWASRKFYHIGMIFKVMVILLIPFLFFSLLGLSTGHGFMIYIKTYASTLINLRSNGTLNPDLLFYPRFLIDFANPVLILTLVWALWFYRNDIRYFSKRPSMMALFLIFTVSFLVFASFTRKAPRALLFADLLLHLNLYLFLTAFIKKKWIASSLITLTVAYSFFQVYRHIYQYSHTSYPEMAREIQSIPTDKILLTTGMNIIPYLKDMEWKVIFDDSEADELIESGYDFVLIDDYHILTGMEEFNDLEDGIRVAGFEEISLHSPILALEHAEFVRISYDDALELSERIRKNPENLRLIRLKP